MHVLPRLRLRAATALAGLAVLATACTATAGAPAPTSGPATSAVPAPGAPAATPASVADVVDRLSPSVVTVRPEDGLGSGVVYRPDVVITNAHVVGDAREVTVDFADGTSAAGSVLATDTTSDIAVIRTARNGLPVPRYCTDLPRPGDAVLAIGSPLGFESTVTAGIVSGLNRQIPGSAAQSRALVDLIQVDAAISPGNSGGALLDATGCFIGINEAYIPPAAGAVSIGFAIAAASAVDVADQLLEDGTATHPFLGVSLGRLTPEVRQSLGVQAEGGVLVLATVPGGPAAGAGVQAGDVLVGLAGRELGSIEDLLAALRGTEPGQSAPLAFVRGGQRQEVQVTIGAEQG